MQSFTRLGDVRTINARLAQGATMALRYLALLVLGLACVAGGCI